MHSLSLSRIEKMEEMAAVTPMVRTSLKSCIVSISLLLLMIDQAIYHYTTLFNPSLNQQRLLEDGVIFFDYFICVTKIPTL